jgi:DNA polymerase-3 subunit epsilon
MWPFRQSRPDDDGGRASVPPADTRYVVIDTELTGLDERRDAIVSLGGLRIAEGRIDLADRYYEEVRPGCALSPASIVVHEITPQQVRDRPEIGAVLEGFAAFCGGDVLVGHFVGIDLWFLQRERERCGLPPTADRAVDTWPLYDWLASRHPEDGGPGLPRLQDPRLPELAHALGVRTRGGHNALSDAFVTAQVFQRLLRRLPRWGVRTTGQLLRIADPRRATDQHRDRGTLPLA